MSYEPYEFEPPEEVKAWLQHQAEEEQEQFTSGIDHYILVNGKIKIVPLVEWAKWMDDGVGRRVERSEPVDGVIVSTVFLGLDHGFGTIWKNMEAGYRPVLFETMVFGGKLDQFQWRYSSLGEAKMGHYEVVDAVVGHRAPNMVFGEEGFWSMFREMFEPEEGDEDS